MARIDWENLFLKDLNLSFAIEIALRTFIMFVLLLVFLRSSGKKGIRQLSIFEVAIIIALGSAAGDPMLNGESPILPSLLVFAVILAVYRLITYAAARSQKIENILEGIPMHIIEDGMFTLTEQGDANFAKDEFFAEMRVKGIEHLGQVKTALLETNGQVSFLFFKENEVKKGLPIFPRLYLKKSAVITLPGDYACTHCGRVESLDHTQECSRCGKQEWVPALDNTRIA